MYRRSFLLGGVAAACMGVDFVSAAALVGDWPRREIHVIIPVSVGGANDLLARAIFTHVGKKLGASFVVMNYPGGGAVQGTSLLASSKNDGYTIGNVPYSGLLLSPHITHVPYRLADFDMLGSAGEPMYGVAVKVDSPITTMKDLVDAAKKRRITVASNTVVNMACMFQLATLTGANFKWIPTSSETQAVLLVGSGDADCAVQSAPELNAGVDGGRIKLIASANTTRWPNRPQTPTIIEQGYNVDNTVPLGYGAPVGVNPAIRAVLEKAILDAARDPDVLKTMQSIGVVSHPLDANGLRQTFQKSAPVMEKVLADAGMKKF
jgi:tripartite-type tricarboxylate transporter receptor subunit TctC